MSSLQYISAYFEELQNALSQLPMYRVEQVVAVLLETARQGGKVFILGNGGSAATASHFACDLAKNTMVPDAPRFQVICLNDNIPLMTAWANDTAYDNIFAAQLSPLVEPGDVVIGISCSGNSPNVLNAMVVARHHGAFTIAFTGDRGGRLKDMVDLCIGASSPQIEQQEDIHLALEHCICATIRDILFREYRPIGREMAFASSQMQAVAVN